VSGAIFFAPKLRLRIGVAYAHEGGRTNRWFLGLEEGKFDHAVLLCESKSGRVTHLSLPREFIAKYGSSFPRKDGQLKINLVMRGGEFCLLLPPGRPINVEQFRDNFYGLASVGTS
jgi:hypothetical protein